MKLGKASAVMFGLSCALPAIAVVEHDVLGRSHQDGMLWGLQCLGTGFLFWPGWLANPLLALGALFHARKRHTIATTFAVLALISALLAPGIIESSGHYDIRYLHAGYYLWVGSIVLFAAAAIRRLVARPGGFPPSVL